MPGRGGCSLRFRQRTTTRCWPVCLSVCLAVCRSQSLSKQRARCGRRERCVTVGPSTQRARCPYLEALKSPQRALEGLQSLAREASAAKRKGLHASRQAGADGLLRVKWQRKRGHFRAPDDDKRGLTWAEKCSDACPIRAVTAGPLQTVLPSSFFPREPREAIACEDERELGREVAREGIYGT
ncbi:hypothetical protein K491DRAFT_76627 [Lophiostoma macrostomum CBS 122681]|uniref:Uncharacterized protein n=1 Tax=Lophiostoma macrostomum CBS 122681 TaxID=1314788 RepID=A0A6A6SXX1_9PLEO|nr:hypothetical protein K491DRAFT_76627 [Lophiostoma macrostomum CBS 122681]